MVDFLPHSVSNNVPRGGADNPAGLPEPLTSESSGLTNNTVSNIPLRPYLRIPAPGDDEGILYRLDDPQERESLASLLSRQVPAALAATIPPRPPRRIFVVRGNPMPPLAPPALPIARMMLPPGAALVVMNPQHLLHLLDEAISIVDQQDISDNEE